MSNFLFLISYVIVEFKDKKNSYLRYETKFRVSGNTPDIHDRPCQSEKPTHVNLRLIE